MVLERPTSRGVLKNEDTLELAESVGSSVYSGVMVFIDVVGDSVAVVHGQGVQEALLR